jgi:lysophospholipase L1-like esterase
MPGLARKTTTAIGCFALGTISIHYAPLFLAFYYPRPPEQIAKLPPSAEVLLSKKIVTAGKIPVLADPYGALNRFFSALARTQARQPGAVTRILHYGDSPTTADLITADVRALLQRRFGDAGHGYVLIDKPWAWYGHRGVQIRSSGWRIEAASMSRARDKLHGLGGVSFVGAPGATARIRLPDAAHRSMEVYYLRRPDGGEFRIEAGDHTLATVATAHESAESAFASIDLPPATAEVRLSVTAGAVRLFGISFEKREPGVVYHSLGLNGASIQMALWHFDAAHWAGQLRHANPDLVVINYGSNESFFGGYLERHYPDELRQLLLRLKKAVPEASILVMSPMDRGERNGQGEIVTPGALPRVIEIQHQVAMETRCAFFNTFEAMGGAGTMARWYNGNPRMVAADFLHPTPQGAGRVGALFNQALVERFERWRSGWQ